MVMLDWFIRKNMFLTDPEAMSECLDGDFTLPLIDESHPPVAETKRRFSPEDSEIIEEIEKLLGRGVIRPT